MRDEEHYQALDGLIRLFADNNELRPEDVANAIDPAWRQHCADLVRIHSLETPTTPGLSIASFI